MNRQQQQKFVGVTVDAMGDGVILESERRIIAMTPQEARHLCKSLARAIFRAEIVAFDHELEAQR